MDQDSPMKTIAYVGVILAFVAGAAFVLYQIVDLRGSTASQSPPANLDSPGEEKISKDGSDAQNSSKSSSAGKNQQAKETSLEDRFNEDVLPAVQVYRTFHEAMGKQNFKEAFACIHPQARYRLVGQTYFASRNVMTMQIKGMDMKKETREAAEKKLQNIEQTYQLASRSKSLQENYSAPKEMTDEERLAFFTELLDGVDLPDLFGKLVQVMETLKFQINLPGDGDAIESIEKATRSGDRVTLVVDREGTPQTIPVVLMDGEWLLKYRMKN